jgi:hypothetical protein
VGHGMKIMDCGGASAYVGKAAPAVTLVKLFSPSGNRSAAEQKLNEIIWH